MKAPTALQRGMACLCCRKRKMKCDGARPVCAQCSKANRGSECQYYEKKRTSRTQLLQAKITKLEARLRELEAEQSPLESSSSSGSQSPQIDRASLALHSSSDITFDASAFSTPELDNDYLLGTGDLFSSFDDDVLLPDFSHLGSGRVAGWSAESLEFANPVDAFLAPSPTSSAGMSSLHSPPATSSNNWWESDVFCKNKEMLLDIFFAHRHQCTFDVHIGRFKAALLMPNAQKPHPSLVDAIYLLACYFSRSPPFTDLEPHFLKRSLRGIADALQHSDRIVHVLQASCLLSVYFFWHGSTLEGYYHSSIAARLAVGLGLHQIRGRDSLKRPAPPRGYQNDASAPLKASVPLDPPIDEVEYAERVAAFWQIFSVDRSWAVATGLPTALPDDDHPRSKIQTMWPIAIPDDPNPALTGMLQPFVGSHLSGSSAVVALHAKTIALYERTARFSATTSKVDSLYSLEMSLSQISADLSEWTHRQYSLPFVVSPVDLAVMQSMIYAATIHLHRDALEIQPQSYQKCLWAANGITGLIRQHTDEDYQLMSAIVSACWRTAAEVYIRMLAMPQGATPNAATLIEDELDVLVGALQKLGTVFRIAGIYAGKVQEDRVVSRQASYVPSVI